MAYRRLFLRVGAPFVLVVLAAFPVLAFTLTQLIDAADRSAFADLVAQNRAYIEASSLDVTEHLAQDLQRVTGLLVFHRRRGVVAPVPPPDLADLSLATMPADGQVAAAGKHEGVGIGFGVKGELLFVRTARRAPLGVPVLTVLAACLALAMLSAWMVVRGIVKPLRNLASHLPGIDGNGAFELPEARRPDEIGDLARAFLRTRTALHEAQESRQRMEKFAVLGRMTAGLAHEVQNPVAAIRFHAQLWREGTAHPSARTIEHEAARIESMLNQWMYLTRPEPPARTPLDVGALLASIVEMQRSQAEHADVAVSLDAAGDLVVAADGRRLEQVFRNLLTNAVQAMPGGGELDIRARRGEGGLVVEFLDRGRGFSPAALERFAEFFFSEKEGGMGIGLSVAQEIVRAHGGTLTAANRPDGGAAVTVRIPAGDGAEGVA